MTKHPEHSMSQFGEATRRKIGGLVASIIVRHQLGDDLSPQAWMDEDGRGRLMALILTPDGEHVALQPARVIRTHGVGRVQAITGAPVVVAPAIEQGWDELEDAITSTLLASIEVR